MHMYSFYDLAVEPSKGASIRHWRCRSGTLTVEPVRACMHPYWEIYLLEIFDSP